MRHPDAAPKWLCTLAASLVTALAATTTQAQLTPNPGNAIPYSAGGAPAATGYPSYTATPAASPYAAQPPAATSYGAQPPYASTATPYAAQPAYAAPMGQTPATPAAPVASANNSPGAASAGPVFTPQPQVMQQAYSQPLDGRSVVQQTAAQSTAADPNNSDDSFAGGAENLAEMTKRIAALESKGAIEKYPIIRLSGFFQYDTGFFSQTPNNMATLGDMQNGSSFRRARLQGLGYLTEFTRYSVEMDFGNAGAGRPSFQDVWGEQGNLPFVGNFRAGQYRQPITMDSWTNIRHLEFLERSAPFQAFDPFRRVGAMIWRNSEDQMTLFAASVYSTGTTFWNGVNTTYNTLGVDDRFATQIGDNGGVSLATRATHLLYYDPLADNRYLLHVGAGYDFSEIGGQGTTGSFARVRGSGHPRILRGRLGGRRSDGRRHAVRRRYRPVPGQQLQPLSLGVGWQLRLGPFPGGIHRHLGQPNERPGCIL